MLRNHGARPKYHHVAIGGNLRIDALNAAVLRAKLPFLPAWTSVRRENALRYRALFAAHPGIPPEIRLPPAQPQHVYHQYVIRVPRRDALRAHLAASGIETGIYYPEPLHLQPCFPELGYRAGSLPIAERACREVLALPIQPTLTAAAQERVVAAIAQFYA